MQSAMWRNTHVAFLKHKLFFVIPAEHRAHVQSRARMEVNLMLLPLGAAGAHIKEQWVALLSLTATSPCREELGGFPVPILDDFSPHF